MCGVLGFASTEHFQTRQVKQKFFTTGFPLLAIDRGMESSGLALVDDSPEPILYKKALCGWDFLQQFQTQKYLNDIEKYQVALGHVRASTKGNVSDYNAHPFQYGHITLVHNGHIRNASQLKDADKAECTVDSAMVAYSMAHNGELDTLQSVDGGFVFIWWNSQTKKLNIARNTERPLFLAYINRENSMYWASEMTHLAHLLRNADIDEEIGPLYPGSMTWYQYDLKDLRRPEKVPFVRSQGRQSYPSNRGGALGNSAQTKTGEDAPWQGWTDEELDDWERLGTQTIGNLITKGSDRRSRTMSDMEEIQAIRENLRHQRAQDARQAGIPTSKKRINRAKNELKKMGLEFGHVRVCYAISWHIYKNQRGFGSMMCRMRGNGGHLVEVINVRDTEYPLYMQDKTVLVDCYNVRKGADGHVRVVGVISKKMEARLEHLRTLEKKSKEQQAEIDTEGTKASLGSIERDHDGPGGAKITRARFLELVTGGCANCQRTIDPAEHGSVVWVGTPASPVCHDCQSPGIMESLGFPDHHKLVH